MTEYHIVSEYHSDIREALDNSLTDQMFNEPLYHPYPEDGSDVMETFQKNKKLIEATREVPLLKEYYILGMKISKGIINTKDKVATFLYEYYKDNFEGISYLKDVGPLDIKLLKKREMAELIEDRIKFDHDHIWGPDTVGKDDLSWNIYKGPQVAKKTGKRTRPDSEEENEQEQDNGEGTSTAPPQNKRQRLPPSALIKCLPPTLPRRAP
jgi:hypothetical protein